ncbi:DNA-processing protein DprA [Nocardioides perillae]|uniref:DNA processing protein n=1 Tax=Nocardioides perillae TaxID=1119534 RepID=A0A7Y9RU54_9ACTN|nr:DNA processing protein [Nocardioides perillae]
MSAPTAARAGDEDRLARAALSRVVEPGDHRVLRLVRELGAVTVRDALLAQRGQAPAADVAARLAEVDPHAELDRAARTGLRFVVPGDQEWPSGLDDLARPEPLQHRGDVPLGLWVRGPLRLDALHSAVAVVGARSATTYGTRVAGDLAAAVGRAGLPVLSGAAFGIDDAAHRGALGAGGTTVAVLACGADRVYPEAHRSLVEHLAATAAVVSETPPGGAPTRVRFLSRNRLIAALGRGTVVVEAAVRSGALNTANWTERLHRPLGAVPGPVTSAASQGAHQLVRSGAAAVVTSGQEVLELVGRAGEALVDEPRAPARPRDRISARQRVVLDAVPVGRGVGSDAVARACGFGLVETGAELQRLRALGLVDGDAGWRLTDLARRDRPEGGEP